MNSFNNNISKKVIDYLDNQILKYIQDRDNEGRQLKLVKWDMAIPNNLEINTLFTKGITAYITLLLEMEVLDKDGNLLVPVTSQLLIPRMINNIFIIDGTPRIPTQTLDNDYVCRIYKNNITINRRLSIAFDEENKKDYKITYYDDDDNQFTLTSRDDLTDKNLLPILELSDREGLKIKIKLNYNEKPKYLTREIINDLIQLGPDLDRDNIIDKRIITTEINLMDSLYSRPVKKKIRSGTLKKFWQYGSIYLTDLQNALDRYFKVADDTSIDIPQTVNPLVYDSLRYKIVFPKHVTYNKSMADLIDPIDTPENNNVNRLNQLNVCADIDEGEIYITCYNLNGDKVRLPYIEYLDTPILINNEYNYQSKKIKDKQEYQIKLRQRIITVSNLDDYPNLLVEPSADDKLSIATRRIPMINMSDTVRVAMASSMEKQAIEVEASETPLISSGNDTSDIQMSTLITRYTGKVDSKVIGIKDNRIILDTNSCVTWIDVQQPIVGANDSVISFVPQVKVGDTVKNGDTLITPKILKKGSYELGVNAKAFYMNYLGLTYEDGIVISKSFADKLTSYGVIELSYKLYRTDILRYLRTKGERVKSGDVLVRADTPLRGSKVTNSIYDNPKGLLNKTGFDKASETLIVKNNIEEAYVVSIAIGINPDVNYQSTSEVTSNYLKDFTSKDEVSEDWNVLPDRYHSIKSPEPSFIDERAAVIITYKLVTVRRAMIGTKLCNRYGSKGEVSLVLPDHLMPRLDEDGNGNGTVADIILNPAAVVSRKNPSQLMECLLSKIITSVYVTAVKMIKDNKISEAKAYVNKYYRNQFEDLTDDQFVELISKGRSALSMNVGSYAKFDFDEIMKWAKELNISETHDVYCPDVMLAESKHGKIGLDPDSVNQENLSELRNARVHELGFLEAPIITGETYILKLYHSADYVGKVTPSVIDAAEPLMNRGNYREQAGQKIGEMELWSLLSYGSEKFVSDQTPNMLLSQYEFINEMLLAGYALVDNDNLPLLSSYRTRALKDKN